MPSVQREQEKHYYHSIYSTTTASFTYKHILFPHPLYLEHVVRTFMTLPLLVAYIVQFTICVNKNNNQQPKYQKFLFTLFSSFSSHSFHLNNHPHFLPQVFPNNPPFKLYYISIF